ncbi:MAG TPA: Asp-tRNA(Asn)/Glu-tRNA(Gln) amidotransferase subunit GatC [Candidatus Saccharimonadales bacterium]|nr:Asp-tRNA(Asn)/Glu-tRNA(Gln) amidotransferase subunit GatC [Candidatus Saccharimonadales bacterium]
MAKLSRDEVLKLARLARLHLTAEEVGQFTSEISAILAYVEQLQGVELADVEPTDQVTGLKNVTRPDVLLDYGYQRDELLKNLPDSHGRHIKVKRMLT